jgi:hypothetical protein
VKIPEALRRASMNDYPDQQSDHDKKDYQTESLKRADDGKIEYRCYGYVEQERYQRTDQDDSDDDDCQTYKYFQSRVTVLGLHLLDLV